MKFGKVANIEKVDFSLPADPPVNQVVWEKADTGNPVPPAHMYLGCTGWSMKEWVGKVYPKGTPAKDYLSAYGQQFNTIELNTTHYRIPSAEQVRKWLDQTPEDFRFCPKVPQSISHSRDLGIGGQSLAQFSHALDIMGVRLGCCFIQLPPYFGHDRLQLLDRFLRGWPDHHPLAVEVRHESWFDQSEHLRDFLLLLEKYEKTAVITDVAGRRDVAHMGVTGPTTMIRFVGNGLHSSDYQRIDAWVERLENWAKQGVRDIYFFPHEPDNILAPELTQYVAEQVGKWTSFVYRGPTLIEDDAGEQMSLF